MRRGNEHDDHTKVFRQRLHQKGVGIFGSDDLRGKGKGGHACRSRLFRVGLSTSRTPVALLMHRVSIHQTEEGRLTLPLLQRLLRSQILLSAEDGSFSTNSGPQSLRVLCACNWTDLHKAVPDSDTGAAGTAGSDAHPDGACPSCGDTPYGLMINCSGCSRQHHSSCVPEGRRVGKGLAAVFHCSTCVGNNAEG